jgi:hypothetical protein
MYEGTPLVHPDKDEEVIEGTRGYSPLVHPYIG